MYPQNDVHTSEDILTKMIKKFPLTLNPLSSIYIHVSQGRIPVGLKLFIITKMLSPLNAKLNLYWGPTQGELHLTSRCLWRQVWTPLLVVTSRQIQMGQYLLFECLHLILGDLPGELLLGLSSLRVEPPRLDQIGEALQALLLGQLVDVRDDLHVRAVDAELAQHVGHVHLLTVDLLLLAQGEDTELAFLPVGLHGDQMGDEQSQTCIQYKTYTRCLP